jgi:hypothetical protein
MGDMMSDGSEAVEMIYDAIGCSRAVVRKDELGQWTA